jgi:hypothetical protein
MTKPVKCGMTRPCDGKASVYRKPSGKWSVACDRCHVTVIRETRKEAVESWNRLFSEEKR